MKLRGLFTHTAKLAIFISWNKNDGKSDICLIFFGRYGIGECAYLVEVHPKWPVWDGD
jgi:hypothetical protein